MQQKTEKDRKESGNSRETSGGVLWVQEGLGHPKNFEFFFTIDIFIFILL